MGMGMGIGVRDTDMWSKGRKVTRKEGSAERADWGQGLCACLSPGLGGWGSYQKLNREGLNNRILLLGAETKLNIYSRML